MEKGYVLNFSNSTLQHFVIETTGKDIYDQKYVFRGESKANSLRAFWEIETNYLVSTLLKALIDYWSEIAIQDIPDRDYFLNLEDQYGSIESRLSDNGRYADMDHLVQVNM